ncbi:MAG TPA: glycine cleavage system aminomethyltransferase GcvT, partial [Candidatus Limnocylindrales bacterium]|nr:glycine cleavage system aminomethyltransferase GcvT [Candidatus Limnocylindrales bacterium]
TRLAVGRAGYSLLCAPDGGVLDDLIAYRLAEDRFLVVPNAANRELVAEVLRDRLIPFAATLDDASLRTGLVAVQGPAAVGIVAGLAQPDPSDLHYYACQPGTVAGIPALVARTGYTGEDGFELFVDWDRAGELWDRLLEAGRGQGAVPAGLGARDTLRLEAGMPLYGHELDPFTNPFEAGLGRVVKLDKDADFPGREVLERVAATRVRRTLVGLAVRGRGVARQGYTVVADGTPGPGGDREPEAIGRVTSGTVSPSLGLPIAMAYVPPGSSEPGTMLGVAVRDVAVAAEVVPLPFYSRRR